MRGHIRQRSPGHCAIRKPGSISDLSDNGENDEYQTEDLDQARN